MDERFDELFDRPENRIFQVVFFPDRIYHARYLNATRSDRYRYVVHEVRSKADITVMKADVHLDGEHFARVVRIEYRAHRLLEAARERGRFPDQRLIAWVELQGPQLPGPVEELVPLHYCRWIDAFQVEIWDRLDTPPGKRHAIGVLDQMGFDASITRVPQFAAALADLEQLRRLRIAVRESDRDAPAGWQIADDQAAWDNFYQRNVQVPNSNEPSDSANTVMAQNYSIDFQRGFFLQSDQVAPVRYRNAMMNDDDPRAHQGNITSMRWLLQEELGGSVVFFHEVTVPPGVVEGAHRHIGSEELYYVVAGSGTVYMGEHDDPALDHLPTVEQALFGLDPRPCKAVPVQPGSVVFTKSGGIHGIENTGDDDLRFVAFLYHSA